MIGPVVRFVWHRKRQNSLLILEVFFSFLVVFVVATLGVDLWDNYHLPLGFNGQDVWSVTLARSERGVDSPSAEQNERFEQLLREVRGLEPVVAAAGSTVAPYEVGGMYGAWTAATGRRVEVQISDVTDGARDVLSLEMVQGRWFEPGDDALDWRPVVIDQGLAAELYGAEDPLGKQLRERDSDSDHNPRERVVGVMSAFRKGGELSEPGSFAFRRARLKDADERAPRRLLLRLKPGTPAAFEEELMKRMQAVAPLWSFQVESLEQSRATSFRLRLAPVVAGGVVGFFLLVMVALGLSGVLWQNVIGRTREIGLRRAVGATRWAVLGQILLELVIVTLFGLVLGTLLVVQAPLLGAGGIVSRAAFVKGLSLALAVMIAMACACGLYPGWLASRVQPADALRYE
jgi:putative ABC transport system permease protein